MKRQVDDEDIAFSEEIAKIQKADPVFVYSEREKIVRQKVMTIGYASPTEHNITMDIHEYIKQEPRYGWSHMEPQVKEFLKQWQTQCSEGGLPEAHLISNLRSTTTDIVIQDISYLITMSQKSTFSQQLQMKEDYLVSVFTEMAFLYPEDHLAHENTHKILWAPKLVKYCNRQQYFRENPGAVVGETLSEMDKKLLELYNSKYDDFRCTLRTSLERRTNQECEFTIREVDFKEAKKYVHGGSLSFELLRSYQHKVLEFDAFVLVNEVIEKGMEKEETIEMYQQYFNNIFQ